MLERARTGSLRAGIVILVLSAGTAVFMELGNLAWIQLLFGVFITGTLWIVHAACGRHIQSKEDEKKALGEPVA